MAFTGGKTTIHEYMRNLECGLSLEVMFIPYWLIHHLYRSLGVVEVQKWQAGPELVPRPLVHLFPFFPRCWEEVPLKVLPSPHQ